MTSTGAGAAVIGGASMLNPVLQGRVCDRPMARRSGARRAPSHALGISHVPPGLPPVPVPARAFAADPDNHSLPRWDSTAASPWPKT